MSTKRMIVTTELRLFFSVMHAAMGLANGPKS
jgi:hypothetical protein